MKNIKDVALISGKMRYFAAYCTVVLLLFLNGIPGFASGQQIKISAGIDIAGIEQDFLEAINYDREKKGLQPLLDHWILSRVSLEHSQKMAEEESLDHDFPAYKTLGDRLNEAGLSYRKAGENIAFSPLCGIGEVHRGFMESPAHRDNILEPGFTHCSVRIVIKDRYLYITQEFVQLPASFTSLQQGEIVSVLEETLAAWFKDRFKYRPAFFPALRDFAEFCAEENLQGRKVSSFNESWGNFYLVNLVSPDIGELKKKLLEQVRDIDFEAAVIGAVRGSSCYYPGGAYAVTALLFPGNKYREKSDERLRMMVLKEINKTRERHRCAALRFSKALSESALAAARLYYDRREESLNYPEARQVLVFQAYDPRIIPAELGDLLSEQPRSGKIGVSVFSPLKYGLPGNFFIIAIIIADF